MGCGSSSLKGEGPAGTVGGDEPAPRLKKTETNFNTPDYDADAPKGRRMTEYAPHETVRQKSENPRDSEEGPEGRGGDSGGGPSDVKDGDGQNLKPYQTISGENDDDDFNPGQSTSKPVVNGDSVDPTSSATKEQFADANDPANSSKQDPASLSPGSAGKERKRSWLGQKYKEYSDSKEGRNTSFTDEELKKYTGKDNSEIKQMVEEGKGVGGGQDANAIESPGPGTRVAGMVSTGG